MPPPFQFRYTARTALTCAILLALLPLGMLAVGCQTPPAAEAETDKTEMAMEEETATPARQTVPPVTEVPEMIVVRTGPAFSAPEIHGGAEPMDFLKERENRDYQHHIEIRRDAAGREYRLGVLLHKGNAVTPPAIGQTRQTDIGTFRYLGDTPTEEHPVRVGWLRVPR